MDTVMITTGLPVPLLGPPVVAPPDTTARYVAADGSIVEVIRRECAVGRFTAFVHQAWEDGSEYDGDSTFDYTDFGKLKPIPSQSRA